MTESNVGAPTTDARGRPAEESADAGRLSRLAVTQRLRGQGALTVLVIWTSAFALGVRLWLLPWRYFDADELLAVHSSWAITHGRVMFRDFFETHPIGIHVLLAPLFWILRPDTSPYRATALLFAARGLMFVAAVGIVAVTALVGVRWRGARVAALAVTFLVTTFAFQEKTLEIRPDVPAALLLMAAVLCAVGAARLPPDHERELRRRALVAGLLFGVTLVFTTKALFAGIGLIVGLAVLPGRGTDLKRRTRLPLLFAAGAALPGIAMLLYFVAVGGARGLYTDLVSLSTKWPRYGLEDFLSILLMQNFVLIVLGAIGCHRVGAAVFTRRSDGGADSILLFTSVSILVGLLLSPSTFLQYHLLYLPIWALFAASAGSDFVDYLFGQIRSRERARRAAPIAALVTCVALLYVWSVLRESDLFPDDFFSLRRHVWALLFQFAVAAGLVWLIARVGLSRTTALACAAATLIVLPAFHLVSWETFGDRAQLDAIGFVIDHTKPTDAVLDGYSGAGAFRPAAYPYFLALDVQQMIPARQRQALRDGLIDGTVRPSAIVLDLPLRYFLSYRTVVGLRKTYAQVFVRPRVDPFDPSAEEILVPR